MTNPIFPAVLYYRDDGRPCSSAYNDIYYSDCGALGQARHVFLDGNQLPARWAKRRIFTIVETGFGTGLNFLVSWLAWQADPQACERLHYVSFEKHPLTRADLAAILSKHLIHQPDSLEIRRLAEAIDALLAQWPVIFTSGLHRLEFAQGKVVLTLGFGDATQLAAGVRLRSDAFFLDGFSPARNPDMWDSRLFKALARLADEDATLATYTSAGEVRRNLIAAGFAARRAPGYGSKREMLVAKFTPRWKVRRHPPPIARVTPCKDALVIGAGLAGCSLVERLAARGWDVTLIDRAAGPANDASGNPAGVFHPMITRDEGLAARWSRAGFLYALDHWAGLAAAGHPIRWSANGLVQKLAELGEELDETTPTPLEIANAPGLPEAIARKLDISEAQTLSGVAIGTEAWLFHKGGWIDPVSLCHAHLAAAGSRLHCRFGQNVARLEQRQGRWHALDAHGASIGSATVVVLANAHDAARLADLKHAPSESIRGQLTLLPKDLFPTLSMPVIGGGYLTPTPDGLLTGASYGLGNINTDIDPDEHIDNLQRLAALLPNDPRCHGERPFGLDPTRLEGRVAFRCVTRDRMPMIGPLADETTARARAPSLSGARPLDLPRTAGLYGAFGYGSRGLIWSALGAELLASLIEGEVPPLETDLIDAVDPARYLLRDLRRGKVG